MYSARVVRCPGSQCHRAARHAPALARQASSFPAPWFRHRGGHPFAAGFPDFAPLFRGFDESATRAFDDILGGLAPSSRQGQGHQTFSPRFDVREVENAYELRGELPGVQNKDLEVEFTDPNTLVIRGRTESETTSGTPPAEKATAQTEAATTAADASDTASVHSNDSASSYVKPSVEDEVEESAAATTKADAATESTVAAPQTAEQPHYWVSERTKGSFQRTFNFPGRINHDGVTANLKNGILELVVPKQPAPEARRIEVQ